jgi:hypothetical protein
MYIDDNSLLQLAGIEQHELHGGYRDKPLNSGQVSLIAAFYLGQKLEDLNNTLSNLQNTQIQQTVQNLDNALMAIARVLDDSLLWSALTGLAEAVTKITDTWKENHEMPAMRVLLQKIHSYHRRQS